MQSLQKHKLPGIIALLCLLPITYAIPYLRPLGAPIPLLIISLIILWHFLLKGQFKKNEFIGMNIFLIFSLSLTLSLFLSPVEFNADSTLINKYLKLAIFFLGVPSIANLIKNKNNVRKIFLLSLIGVAIACLYGLIIDYNLHNFRNPVNVFRYTSVSQNSLGNWTPAIFLIGLFLLTERENKYKFFTGSLLLIIIITQILTLSRVGYFMIFSGLIIWWLFCIQYKAKIISLILITILCFGFIQIFEKHFIKAYERASSLSTPSKIIDSSRGRAANFVKGFDAFINYPLLGVGLNNFREYSTESIDLLETVGYPDINEETHSLYIDLYAELGIIGILFFSYFFIPILLFRKKHYHLHGEIYLVTKFAVWLIMLRGFTSNEFISNPVNILIFSSALFLSQNNFYAKKNLK